MEALKISMSGMDVEWQRLRVIAENLANINSTRGALGQTYKPKRLLSGPSVSFEALLSGSTAAKANAAGVQVMSVEAVVDAERKSFEPEHPHSDENGFVTYPKIDHATEMALMIKTSRVYEANLTALTLSRQMYSRALEMGR